MSRNCPPRFGSGFLLGALICASTLACSKAKEAPAPRVAESDRREPAPAADPRYTALPTPIDSTPWHPPAVAREPTDSGLTVWHLEQGPLPLVSIQLVLPRGSASDPEGKEGLTRLTADLLDEGAGKRTALELSDALGVLATDYSASTGVDYVLLSMNALSENFDESMELLSDIVLRPQLTPAEFDRRRKHHQAEVLSAQSDPQSRVRVGVHRVLFGEGYASRPDTGSTESLDRITLKDVREKAKSLTVAGEAHLVVAGKISKEEIFEALGKYFKGWKGAPKPEKPELGAPLPSKTAYVVDFPGAAQSALAVVQPAGDAHDPRFFDELVMNQKFGGSFTGRINMNLREDKGYTYGAFAYFRRYDKAGYFAIASNVVSEKTSESIQEIFSEISDLCTSRPLSSQEYQEAKDGLLLGYPMEFSRVDSLGTKLASLPIYGRDPDYWSRWPAEVDAVSLGAARSAALPYCKPEDYRVVVAGDLASIRPGLQTLGLSVVELDRDGHPKASPGPAPEATP